VSYIPYLIEKKALMYISTHQGSQLTKD